MYLINECKRYIYIYKRDKEREKINREKGFRYLIMINTLKHDINSCFHNKQMV